MLKVAVIGFGAIGEELARVLHGDADLQLTQIVATPRSRDRVVGLAAALAPRARVLNELDLGPERPDLVAECAGHAAIAMHVIPALRAGVPCVLASVGALAEADVWSQIEAAARHGATRVQLIAGAVGAIDALDAARVGGLDRVRYIGRKPPRSWQGTPADGVCELAALALPRVVFEGSARDAALLFPKNANVAATIALAGLGLDRTEVQLIADPGVERNVHRIEASGAFGRLEMNLENLALASNPRTSALTVYSLARALRTATAAVAF
jgi:aspartate dehydrogenase